RALRSRAGRERRMHGTPKEPFERDEPLARGFFAKRLNGRLRARIRERIHDGDERFFRDLVALLCIERERIETRPERRRIFALASLQEEITPQRRVAERDDGARELHQNPRSVPFGFAVVVAVGFPVAEAGGFACPVPVATATFVAVTVAVAVAVAATVVV